MKKFYVLGFSCLFVLTSLYSYSQDEALSKDTTKGKGSRHVSFGIRAGANFASVVARKDNTPKGADIFIRPMGAVYASIPLRKHLAIQAEVLYNGLGWKEKTYPENKFIKYGFTCISVPLLAKYSIENTGLSLYLGPQADFLLSAKVKSDSTVDIKDNYKSTGFTAVGGLEFLFTNGFNISVRYQLGISNLVKNPNPDEYLKLHAFTAGIGYNF